MTMLTDTDIGSGSLRFAKDYVGVDYHNDGHTHIDALCHVAYDGSLYNGRPQGSVDRRRASALARSRSSNDGLVGRGVLLDIPRLRGVPVARAGRAHLRATTSRRRRREQGVAVAEGDILLVRTGHALRLRRARPMGHRRPPRPGCTRRRSRSWPSAGVAALGC